VTDKPKAKSPKPKHKSPKPDPAREDIDATVRAVGDALTSLFDFAEKHGLDPCALSMTTIAALIDSAIVHDHAGCAARTCLHGLRDCIGHMIENGENPDDLDMPGLSIMQNMSKRTQ